MKTCSRLFLFCLGLWAFALPVQAKKKHHDSPGPTPGLATPGSEPGPLPPEAAPQVNPADPPSVSLQPFMDRHLGTILAPLGTSAFVQPEVLASLKASFADAATAAPASHKQAFALAQSVCDAMNGAITERQNAVSALRGALATRSSEAEQPRGGGQAVATARDSDQFFIDSQKNSWLQRAAALRQSVIALGLRERAVERQIGVWNPPPPPTPAPPVTPVAAATTIPPVSAPPVTPVAAAATPSVSAPPPATPDPSSTGSDPVIGQWLLENRSPLTLEANHTVTGGRHGEWRYVCTTNEGRNYEVHFKPPKGWADYVVLSSDGRRLDGHTREHRPISYVRP